MEAISFTTVSPTDLCPPISVPTGTGSTPVSFAIPGLYQYGNSGFDILRGPGLASADAALGRRFSVGERLRLQMRLDVFNLLNQTNFALLNRILGVESAVVISHTSTEARQLEVLARVER